MQLPEASFVPFLRWALAGSLPSWQSWAGGALAHKAFSGPIRLLPEVEHVWIWLHSIAMTFKPPVYTEQQEALTLLVPMASTGLGGKPESTAFLSKDALGLSVVSRGVFHFRECSSKN